MANTTAVTCSKIQSLAARVITYMCHKNQTLKPRPVTYLEPKRREPDTAKPVAASVSLSVLPADILLLVFHHCSDFNDALSLSATCTKLKSMWDYHADPLAYRLTTRAIPRLDNLIIIIRTCARTKSNRNDRAGDDDDGDDDPRALNMFDLTSREARELTTDPTLHEIIMAIKLYHFVDLAIEVTGQRDYLPWEHIVGKRAERAVNFMIDDLARHFFL